jgi:hypothetical protein
MNRFSLFYFSVVAVFASGVGNASACGENAISIQVVDDVGGARVVSIAEVSDPIYRNFLSSVFLRIERLVQESGDCVGAGYSNLLFVRSPLVQSRPVIPLPSSVSDFVFSGCRIYSPWVDFEFENSDAPKVRGVIRWSQRQFLIDQAIMAGDIKAAGVRVTMLNNYEFENYAKYYADLEILHKSETTPLESPIPPDVLWLFQKSWQSTRGPFSLSARNSMHKLMERAAEGYADLVINLIDRCAYSGQGEFHYKNILDLKDVVPVGKYKVESLL